MSRTRAVLAALLPVFLIACVTAPYASAHTDPQHVSPAAGTVVARPVTAVTWSYPVKVSVYDLTVSNGRRSSTVHVGRSAAAFTVPVSTGKGAWVAAWTTRMPDGDLVTQATTWRVGRLPGVARPATLTAATNAGLPPVTLTVHVSDARAGAPSTLRLRVTGGKPVTCHVTTAGVDVDIPSSGGRIVLVDRSSVACMVAVTGGQLVRLSIPIT